MIGVKDNNTSNGAFHVEGKTFTTACTSANSAENFDCLLTPAKIIATNAFYTLFNKYIFIAIYIKL